MLADLCLPLLRAAAERSGQQAVKRERSPEPHITPRMCTTWTHEGKELPVAPKPTAAAAQKPVASLPSGAGPATYVPAGVERSGATPACPVVITVTDVPVWRSFLRL